MNAITELSYVLFPLQSTLTITSLSAAPFLCSPEQQHCGHTPRLMQPLAISVLLTAINHFLCFQVFS